LSVSVKNTWSMPPGVPPAAAKDLRAYVTISVMIASGLVLDAITAAKLGVSDGRLKSALSFSYIEA